MEFWQSGNHYRIARLPDCQSVIPPVWLVSDGVGFTHFFQIVSNIAFRSIFSACGFYPAIHFVPDELFQINRARGYVVFVQQCFYPLGALASVPSAELRVPNDSVLLVARLEYPLQPLTRFGFFQLNRGELNSPTVSEWG
jgi:hypothetical protein